MVIGQGGVVVFVRHGGVLVSVHHPRLCKVNKEDQDKQIVQDDPDRKAENEKTISNNAADSEQNTDTENIRDMECRRSVAFIHDTNKFETS